MACLQPTEQKLQQCCRGFDPHLGGGIPTLRPHQHSQAPVLKSLESEFVSRIIPQVRNGSVGPNFIKDSSNRITFVSIGNTKFNPAVELQKSERSAVRQRGPAQQNSSTKFNRRWFVESAPVDRDASRLGLCHLLQSLIGQPATRISQGFDGVLIYLRHLTGSIGQQALQAMRPPDFGTRLDAK